MKLTGRSEVREAIAAGKARRQRYHEVVCEACGSTRWLRLCDARKESPCKLCDRRAKGRKGYAVTAQRHGQKHAMRGLQAYRLDHPSQPEQALANWFEQLGIAYQREVWIETTRGKVWLVDFVLPLHGRQIAVEFNGAWTHRDRAQSDKRKQRYLKRRGFEVIVLSDTDLQFERVSALIAQRSVA